MEVSQFCFRVAVTDHHTVVASNTPALDPILCSVLVNLLYRQECVYYNYRSKRCEPSLVFGKVRRHASTNGSSDDIVMQHE